MPEEGIKKNNKGKNKYIWVVKVIFITLLFASLFGFVSDMVMQSVEDFVILALTIVFIIAFGVLFDTIGVAVTAANQTTFISMAAKKIKGAQEAIILLKNADKVSNFCNDVIGDICGIISGAAGATMVIKMVESGFFNNQPVLSIILSSIIASLTVGGKGMGKIIALSKSKEIVLKTGYLISFFKIKKG